MGVFLEVVVERGWDTEAKRFATAALRCPTRAEDAVGAALMNCLPHIDKAGDPRAYFFRAVWSQINTERRLMSKLLPIPAAPDHVVDDIYEAFSSVRIMEQFDEPTPDPAYLIGPMLQAARGAGYNPELMSAFLAHHTSGTTLKALAALLGLSKSDIQRKFATIRTLLRARFSAAYREAIEPE